MAARMAGDGDDERVTHRLEPDEPRRLRFRRLIQAVLAHLVEERMRLPPQTLELLNDFLERRVSRGVVDRLAAPVEQRLPLVGRIGRAVQHLLQSALDDLQVPGNPHRVIASPQGPGRRSGASFIPLRCVMPLSLNFRTVQMASNAFIVSHLINIRKLDNV